MGLKKEYVCCALKQRIKKKEKQANDKILTAYVFWVILEVYAVFLYQRKIYKYFHWKCSFSPGIGKLFL